MPDNSLASERFETYRLLSCIKPLEYLALNSDQKDNLRIILACGHIDMNEGSWCRERLFTLFSAETTDTGKAIAELLEYTPPPSP